MPVQQQQEQEEQKFSAVQQQQEELSYEDQAPLGSVLTMTPKKRRGSTALKDTPPRYRQELRGSDGRFGYVAQQQHKHKQLQEEQYLEYQKKQQQQLLQEQQDKASSPEKRKRMGWMPEKRAPDPSSPKT